MILEKYYKKTSNGWERVRFIDLEVGDLIKKHNRDTVYRVYKPSHYRCYWDEGYRRTIVAKIYRG